MIQETYRINTVVLADLALPYQYLCYFHFTSESDGPSTVRAVPQSRSHKLDKLRAAIYSLDRPADEKYAINETKSQTLSVTRDIPDTRPSACLDIHYNLSSLPTVR